MDDDTLMSTGGGAAGRPRRRPAQGRNYDGLSRTVMSFVTSQLGLKPAAIFIDDHGASITVTLKGVLSESERNAAQDRRTAELVVRALTEAFRSVSGVLVTQCSAAIGETVEAALFSLEPRSNYATIVLSLTDYEDA